MPLSLGTTFKHLKILFFFGFFLLISNKTNVFGGVIARENEFPHMVSLFFTFEYKSRGGIVRNFAHFCGGTLVGKNVVLTAAHCIVGYLDVIKYYDDGNNVSPIKALIGSNTLGTFSEDSIVVEVFSMKKHPNFSYENNMLHDVGILLLKENVYENGLNIRYAEIDDGSWYPEGEGISDIIAIGFGANEESAISSELRSLKMVMLPKLMCAIEDASFYMYYCMGVKFGEHGLKGMRPGDSGGAIVITKSREDKRFTVVGIATAIQVIRGKYSATLFTQLTSNRKFINKYVKKLKESPFEKLTYIDDMYSNEDIRIMTSLIFNISLGVISIILIFVTISFVSTYYVIKRRVERTKRIRKKVFMDFNKAYNRIISFEKSSKEVKIDDTTSFAEDTSSSESDI